MVQFPGGPSGPAPSSQQVSEWIRERIRRGQFVPEQRLVEVDIIRSTGCSRVRVREALQRLSAEGLVTIEPFRGASVRSISMDELRHIYRARVALEGTAAADFALHAADHHRERLQQVQDELERCIVDKLPERFGKLNAEWHGLIVEGSGNTVLGELLQRLSVPIHRLLFESFYDADRLRTANEDHRMILKAVMARDPEAAEHAMRNHVDAGFRTLSAIEREYQV